MKIVLCYLFVMLQFSVSAQQPAIIPQPVSVKTSNGQMRLSMQTVLVTEGTNLQNVAGFFNDYLQKYYAFKLKIATSSNSKNVIRLSSEKMEKSIPGAYRLDIDDNGILIVGDNETGVFYGIQTLIQLLPVPDGPKSKTTGFNIPFVNIADEPRFAYRGLHLDVSRHFFPIDFVKKYIDYIALHKMNYFHWHLTEDQGWRIEIKKYPKLTEVGAWRNGTIIGRYPGKGNDGIRYGGYYTQEQIKDVVAYAQKRYITVIPEIEMPGHSSAAIAAYPELSCFPDQTTDYPEMCAWNGPRNGKHVQQTWGIFNDVYCAGKENTFKFLEGVMDEVLSLFPSQYIHVGGDESPKVHWKKCPACQQRIKDLKLKDEHELQSYFIQRMEKYLNAKGRILIGWDEILEGGLAPNAVVMSWRGEKGGIEAAKEKHNVIMTPGNPVYFDHTQSENEDSVTFGGFNPLEKVYAYEPIPKELNDKESKYVLGAQANMWTEYMKNTRKVEYMLFPRLSALSEVLWTPKKNKDWSDFEKRLLVQFKRFDLWKANYSKAYFAIKTSISPTADYNGILLTLESKGKDSIFYIEKRGMPTPVLYTQPLRITKSEVKEIKVRSRGKIVSELSMDFKFNKATGKKISVNTSPTQKYPGDGPFTLVNGLINTKGFARSREFLGFNGEDCEAVIDLGKATAVTSVIVHCLDRKSSWIWRPQSVEAFGSDDGRNWVSLKITDDFIRTKATEKGIMKMHFNPTNVRFLKVLIRQWGVIPAGNPGAGENAWLFIDEIEVH